jgi:hypothetical protein
VSIPSPIPSWTIEAREPGEWISVAEQDAIAKLLALLGLAHRAGRLAIGASAVTDLVHRGRRPLVITARDAGPGQLRRWRRLAPVGGFLDGVVTRGDLARALGRRELSIVALDDRSFVTGIARLGLGGSRRTRSETGSEPKKS